MSNWFENNAAKSIITYTLLVAATTWGVSTFLLKDNRLNLARSELESQRATADQYKAKVEMLQTDIDRLRSENAEYRDWLGQMENAIPVIAPRMSQLKQEVAQLKEELKSQRATNPDLSMATQRHSATLGSAFIDDRTGLILAVRDTTPERTALVNVHFPEDKNPIEETVAPGKKWTFLYQGKKLKLTISDVQFYSDTVVFRIDPAN